MSSGEIGARVFDSFRKGMDLGGSWREDRDKRKAGEAMAGLAGFDPDRAMAQPQDAAPVDPTAVEEDRAIKQSEQLIEGGAFGQQSEGKPKLPSGRDWVSLRTKALEQASRLGPDAVKSAMDEIDRLQKKGTLDNLYQARRLVNAGRDAEAGDYLERANSYMGNFTSLIAAPAKMRDGSTRVAVEVRDEHSGEPAMPGMIATPEMLDDLIAMIEQGENWSEWSKDRAMAEREWQLKNRKFESDEAYRWDRAGQSDYEFESDEAYRRDQFEDTSARNWSEYNRKLAKDMTDAQSGGATYDPQDYDRTVKQYIEMLPPRGDAGGVDPETGALIPDGPDPARVVEFVDYFQRAAQDPTLSQLRPDEIARFVYQKLTEGYGGGG